MARIDVHHHFVPSSLAVAKADANIRFQWRSPPDLLHWSPQLSLKMMDDAGIDVALLSLPALASGSVSQENRTAARQKNLQLSSLCKEHPTRLGFFAALPFLDDVQGGLAEIAYALDVLNANGIAMSSSYGEGMNAKYIGDDSYDALWSELDRREAVVFLHGAQVPSSTPCPSPFLGVPITEVPNETFKAAAHLVVTGRKRKYSNVKIILAHMGGSLPVLAARVAVLSPHMGCPLSKDKIMEDFASYYFETALSSSAASLAAMDAFVTCEKLLFGTDFPAVSAEMAQVYTTNLEEYYGQDASKLETITSGNALKLFPELLGLVKK